MGEEFPGDRYKKEHCYGEIRFRLHSSSVDPEQGKFILLKVLEQAIRDYIALVHSTLPPEIKIWENAVAFLFDDSYFIDWGDLQLNLEELMLMLDIDVGWTRKQIRRKFEEKHGYDQQRQGSRSRDSIKSNR